MSVDEACDEAWGAYTRSFGPSSSPEITYFLRLPPEQQTEILMRAVENNQPVEGAVAEALEREIYPEVYNGSGAVI
ncbi:hypothetical protein FACS1894116_11040 [Betaproteobacteria bacterium]|nr:hypothetical protein FACS1894116_11040 [Betaproteobacteria bacterium]GHT99283.1 hypothetical protein FACS1894154_06100 [Betaproteobacteria bacterium]GHU25256.1 hypothetical protein FACS189488_11830 [Betaproteobacteria bacterium]GHU32004.1 hypothetical protein FACS189497_13290 [Betaproteobacteria bacterium]